MTTNIYVKKGERTQYVKVGRKYQKLTEFRGGVGEQTSKTKSEMNVVRLAQSNSNNTLNSLKKYITSVNQLNKGSNFIFKLKKDNGAASYNTTLDYLSKLNLSYLVSQNPTDDKLIFMDNVASRYAVKTTIPFVDFDAFDIYKLPNNFVYNTHELNNILMQLTPGLDIKMKLNFSDIRETNGDRVK
jgi:hypothetical protein